jgi:hypothetical protein
MRIKWLDRYMDRFEHNVCKLCFMRVWGQGQCVVLTHQRAVKCCHCSRETTEAFFKLTSPKTMWCKGKQGIHGHAVPTT